MALYNFGSLNIDHVYSLDHIVESGETQTALNYETFVGGKGLNQSIAIARAGGHVIHIGAIGRGGSILKETLEEAGVDTSQVMVKDSASGHAIIQVDKSGANSIVIYGGSNQEIEKADIDRVFEDISTEDIVVLQNEISNVDYIVDKAHERNIKVSLNYSPITDELKKIDLNKVTYLLVNEIEGLAAAQTDKIEDITKVLTTDYPNLNVILTLGDKGAVFARNGQEDVFQDAFKVEVVDTTGAGDTFTGYFLSAITENRPVQEALKIGSKASSLAISRKGASPSIPNRKEVEEQL